MKNAVLQTLLGAVALVIGASALAEDKTGVVPSWGALSDLVGEYWILTSDQPLYYLKYSWGEDMDSVGFYGLDNDGNLVAGQFVRDGRLGSVDSSIIRNGVVSNFDAYFGTDGFVLFGSEGGATVKSTTLRDGPSRFIVRMEELRKGKWILVRELKYIQATDDMIKALGWIEKNPKLEAEAKAARAALLKESPSFFKRLILGLENGIVVGVEEGMKEGVKKRTVRIVGGSDKPSTNEAASTVE